jgi:hypothetical protein
MSALKKGNGMNVAALPADFPEIMKGKNVKVLGVKEWKSPR